MNRRLFLQTSGLAGVGITTVPHTAETQQDTLPPRTVSIDDRTFYQKHVRHYSLDAADLPPQVLQPGTPSTWDHWDQGPVTGLSLYGSDGGVHWLGGDQGAARFDEHAAHLWDRWQYFGSRRWLMDSQVQHIYIDNSSEYETVWIRTQTGVARIFLAPYFLQEKAKHFEEVTERHHVRLGFVARSVMTTPGDRSSLVTSDTDNDGLWTAMYLAAQAYQHAVYQRIKEDDQHMADMGGLASAGRRARRSLEALMKLESITPIPGFYARTYRMLDEPLPHQDNGEWHPSSDGVSEWKGDTSSDESVGHYYGYALYYDLVARDNEKEEIRAVIRRLTDYLIDNNYDLIDLDGIPTRWGRWGEDYYETREGDYEKALRSLELLSFLKTTYHITGDEKYQDAYLDRVRRGYAHYTLEYRRWGSEEWEINYSDDELYYLSIYPLLKYETDPVLRAIYMDGLRFTWSQVQPEANALWNYMSAALGAGPLTPELSDDSRRTLERAPLDLVRWKTTNSHRRDVRMNRSPDRHGKDFLVRVLPPDERPLHKHNGNPYLADGGDDRQLMEPTYWILPYWMGMYYGYLES